jgi:quercetin dioxygenase-like cupin family protein
MNLKIQRWNETSPPDASTLRRRLEDEGYDVFEWSDAPGTVYAPHAHEEDQSHWIISGALQLSVEGETYNLRTGDRDFLPANTMHAAFVPGTRPVRYLIASKRG